MENYVHLPYSSMNGKILLLNKINKILFINNISKRYNVILDLGTDFFSVEDSITKKIYVTSSYEKIILEIKADLRKEKIEKLLKN